MLAVVQFNPARGQRTANLAALAAITADALAAGAKVVVLPEMAATGYRFPDALSIRPMADPVQGETFDAFAALARDHRAHVIVGFVEKFAGHLFNAAIAIGPAGELAAHYRKRLLYEDDIPWAKRGDLPYPNFQTPYGSATIGICMDINGPKFCRHVIESRPTLLCFPTNWIDQNLDYIHHYWAWRLKGWKGWLLAANRWGSEDGVGFWGRSAILRDGATRIVAPPRGDGWRGLDPSASNV